MSVVRIETNDTALLSRLHVALRYHKIMQRFTGFPNTTAVFEIMDDGSMAEYILYNEVDKYIVQAQDVIMNKLLCNWLNCEKPTDEFMNQYIHRDDERIGLEKFAKIFMSGLLEDIKMGLVNSPVEITTSIYDRWISYLFTHAFKVRKLR